jgi:chemotaxis protein CheD
MDKKIFNTINSGKYVKVDLKSGELHIAKKPSLIWTVLGSCVSVIFFNKRLKIGAICHALQAEEGDNEFNCNDFCQQPCYNNVPDSNKFKYVTCAIKYMYETFTKLGICKNEIEVKLFGGANVLAVSGNSNTIGMQNLKIAHKMLKCFDLTISSKNIGGEIGRTLYFYSDTGKVLLKENKSSLLKSKTIR